MLSYNDLKPGITFIKDGEPYRVLDYSFVRMQQRKPVAQLKIKNLISGKVTDYTAHPGREYEEAEIEKVPAKFIYRKKPQGPQQSSVRGGDEFWFRNPEDASDRFMIKEEIIGNAQNYLKEGLEVVALKFKDKIINIDLPVKVELKVTEAPPSIKGSTAQGGTKKVTTETGFEVNTPLFIEVGDVIRINTEKGEYVERVSN